MNKIFFFLVAFALMSGSMNAQRGRHPHHPNRPGVVVVKRSPWRPAKVGVYHPVWHPKWTCRRRWVFFPKYNFYWDNWRNQYLFYNGTAWVEQASPPPAAANANLAAEKYYELKETDDDNDEIASSNESHKAEYKPN